MEEQAIAAGETSNVNKPAPAQPATAPGKADPAVEAYRRAVQARPTGFSDDPFSAAARTMDRLGKAAGKLFSRAETSGSERTTQLQSQLQQAAAASSANPNSTQAKQAQLVAAGRFLESLQAQNPQDPRVAKVAAMMVRLAGQLGPQALPLNVPGLDMRGLLGLAAQLVSRFGSAQGMQQAMTLEQMLAAGRGQTNPQVMQMLVELAQRYSISKSVLQSILKNWTVQLAPDGTLANVDISARTISINNAQSNHALAALAKAHWVDQQLSQPGGKDSLVNAFLKVVNTGKHAELARKYRKQRAMSEAAEATRGPGAVGSTRGQDDPGDMFAALVAYDRDGGDVPPELQSAVDSFLLRA